MSWDSLPAELLVQMFQHVGVEDVSDLYQCLSVSTSWRLGAKEVWRRIGSTSPWLLIKVDYLHKKLSFLKNNFNMISVRLPNDNNLMVHSSYKGWLLLLGTDVADFTEEVFVTSMYLYNPLTRMIIYLPILLPPLLTFSKIKKFITSSCPMDSNCVACVLWEGVCSYMVSFCKPRDHEHCYKWNTLSIPYSDSYASPSDDIIFYQEQLYIIHDDYMFTLNANSMFKTSTSDYGFIRSSLERVKVHNGTGLVPKGRYLVETKIGELLMVERHQVSRKRVSFCVLKFNLSTKEWEEVSGFGGGGHQQLFLATNESTFVSVKEEEFKPDCIIFLDEFSNDIDVVSYGVYDLRDHTFKRFDIGTKTTNDEFITVQWFSCSPECLS